MALSGPKRVALYVLLMVTVNVLDGNMNTVFNESLTGQQAANCLMIEF